MKYSASIGELFKALTTDMSAAEIKTAMVTSDISSKISIERCKRGMTQKQFADYMGVTQGMVSKWESGDYNFTIEAIANIFEKLNLDFNFEIKPDIRLFSIDDLETNLSANSDLNNKLLIAG